MYLFPHPNFNLPYIMQAIEELGMVRFASNGIPSSHDWFQPLEYEGYLDYDIVWYITYK